MSLFPVLHKYNCCLFDAWAFSKFLMSISLRPSNNYTFPTSNDAPIPFRSAMYESSFTSVVCTLGPDFQNEWIKAPSMTTARIPKTIW